MTPTEKLTLKPYELNRSHKDLENLFPIMYAAKYGITTFITNCLSELSPEELIVIINLTNDNKLTALHFACRYGQTATVEALLSFGALSTKTQGLQQLPIHMAFSDKNDLITCQKLFELLFETGHLTEKTALNQTIGHLAAEKNAVSVLMAIHAISPTLLMAKDNLSMPPLLSAVINNQKEATDYLLTISDINATNSIGQNALHIAAKYATLEVFTRLLPHFDIEQRDSENHSVLDLAKASNQVSKLPLIEQALKNQSNQQETLTRI